MKTTEIPVPAATSNLDPQATSPCPPITFPSLHDGSSQPAPGIPAWVTLLYTAFMALLVPVYWTQYGVTNFLYFCDVALFLTLIGLWTRNRLLLSMSAVGILIPQALWCADFAAHFVGLKVTGMTHYMFDPQRSLFLRGLSLFHAWLPFLLVYAVRRLGYDRRAWMAWTTLAWALCLLCFVAMPPAGAEFADQLKPNNINYVWGFDDTQPQTWMPSHLYLGVWMTALFALVYTPTHLVLRRMEGKANATRPVPVGQGGSLRSSSPRGLLLGPGDARQRSESLVSSKVSNSRPSRS